MSERRPGIRKHELFLLAVLLLLRAGLGIAYSLATPLGEAPDEADHFAYAAYILAGRTAAGRSRDYPGESIRRCITWRLRGGQGRPAARPTPASSAPTPTWLSAPAPSHRTSSSTRRLEARPLARRSADPVCGTVCVHPRGVGLRSCHLPAGAGAVAAGGPTLPLGGAAFAAFLPESLFIGGVMSNDMLAAMWSTLALLFTAKLLRAREAAAPGSSDIAASKPSRPRSRPSLPVCASALPSFPRPVRGRWPPRSCWLPLVWRSQCSLSGPRHR